MNMKVLRNNLMIEIVSNETNFEIAKGEEMKDVTTNLIFYLKYEGEYVFSAGAHANGKIRCHLLCKDKNDNIVVDSFAFLKAKKALDVEFVIKRENIPVSMEIFFSRVSSGWGFLKQEKFFYEFNLKRIRENHSGTPLTPNPEDFLLLNNDKREIFKNKYGAEILKSIDIVVNELASIKVKKDGETLISPEGESRGNSREWDDIRSPRSTSNSPLLKKRSNSLGPSPVPNLKTTNTVKHWEKSNLIGEGAYGKVYLGLDQDRGNLIAIKQVDLKGVKMSLDKIRALESEISLLSQLDHANIVKYLGMEKTVDSLYIFLDYISGGTIESIRKKFKLQEKVVREYSKQILYGLEYLHSKDIIHRDIKSSNVLVDVNGVCMLSDFGSAKIVKDLKKEKVLEGTPNYMAPELVKNCHHIKYSKAADVWAFGCTVLEMLTGSPPFYEEMKKFDNAYEFIFWREQCAPMLKIPENLSLKAKSFLSACLQEYPENRKTATELLSHSFLSEVEMEQDFVLMQSPPELGGDKIIHKSQSYQILTFLKESEEIQFTSISRSSI